jgi:hypothetical protein
MDAPRHAGLHTPTPRRPKAGQLRAALAAAFLLAAIPPIHAQPPAPAQKAGDDEVFWENANRRMVAASAQLVGIRDPLAAAAMRIQGHIKVVWPTFVNTVPDLDPYWMRGVRDGQPWEDMRVQNPGDEARLHLRPGYREYVAHALALIYASRGAPDVFARAAEDNDYVKFDHINNEPWKYRGKVIHLDGTLKKLDKYDAPLVALKHGVSHFYVAWIFLRRDLPPIRVDFTELPEGLKVGEDLDRRVSFDGYFFKKWPYQAQRDKAHDPPRVTLLFVAPTLKVQPVRPRAADLGTGLTKTMLMGIIGCVVLTLGLIVALNLWYKRGDRAVQARLTALHAATLFDEQALLEGVAEIERKEQRDKSPPSSEPKA